MQDKPSSNISRVERDPRFLQAFMTLVLTAMYFITLMEQPAVRQWSILIPFTVLLVIHVILHWWLERIIPLSFGVLWYILLQGILAILISWLGGSLGIIFAVFMTPDSGDSKWLSESSGSRRLRGCGSNGIAGGPWAVASVMDSMTRTSAMPSA